MAGRDRCGVSRRRAQVRYSRITIPFLEVCLFVRLVPFREADWLTDCQKEIFATAKKGYTFAVD